MCVREAGRQKQAHMPRSLDMVFNLYGDYIRHRTGEAWTGSLIELLGHMGLSGQAVRSTLSRMSRGGWLKRRRAGRHSFYSLTPKCTQLLEEGARRIFHPRSDPWDGRWHLLIYSIPESKRHLRRRLRTRLRWLGFGMLNHATWICPRDLRRDVTQLADTFGLRPYIELFSAQRPTFARDEEIVARCWDLKGLNAYHAAFIRRSQPVLQHYETALAAEDGPRPLDCFVQRSTLIDEYRASPYVDPNLPPELLPEDWLGERAAQLFQRLNELLEKPAGAFVDAVLAKAPPVRPLGREI
jgi:phenylacetic acid degradation operon negative regulatory protein